MKHYWFGAVLVFLVLRFSPHRLRFRRRQRCAYEAIFSTRDEIAIEHPATVAVPLRCPYCFDGCIVGSVPGV